MKSLVRKIQKKLDIIGMFAQTSWLVKYFLGSITNIYTFLFMFDKMLKPEIIYNIVYATLIY